MSGVDQAVLAQLAEDLSGTDLLMIIETVFADLGRFCPALEAAAAGGDSSHIRASAHAIAGVAGIVGAVDLERQARAIMTDATAGRPVSSQDATMVTALAQAATRDVRLFLKARGARA